MINFKYIEDSIRYYSELGYTRIESPWIVPDAVDAITRPDNVQPMRLEHNGKCLIASGEQSFLYLMMKGFLPEGKYQTVTPCFRPDKFDLLHSKYFIKNELIQTDEVSEENMMKMLVSAEIFFEKHLKAKNHIGRKVTNEGYDITFKGYELGSYGIREHGNLKWIYGTGCAEPRMTTLKGFKL